MGLQSLYVRLGGFMREISDTERLDWLEQTGNGIGLIHDDRRHWAVESDGIQKTAFQDEPIDFITTYLVSKTKCRRTVREAIDAAILEETDEDVG